MRTSYLRLVKPLCQIVSRFRLETSLFIKENFDYPIMHSNGKQYNTIRDAKLVFKLFFKPTIV